MSVAEPKAPAPTPPVLHLLCAGAAQGLVRALQARLGGETGATIQGRFGAVGAMKEALLAGEPCDLFVVTERMVDELTAAGALRATPRGRLGRVRTGVAVRAGDPVPAADTPEALRSALRDATAVYFPDPERATAGIHFANVLARLGVAEELRPRLRPFPNGATAMRELAQAPPGAIGCTQVSEILYTEGVRLVGALPTEFELATIYTAAVPATASSPELASRFIAMLTSPDQQPLRTAGGFEP